MDIEHTLKHHKPDLTDSLGTKVAQILMRAAQDISVLSNEALWYMMESRSGNEISHLDVEQDQALTIVKALKVEIYSNLIHSWRNLYSMTDTDGEVEIHPEFVDYNQWQEQWYDENVKDEKQEAD